MCSSDLLLRGKGANTFFLLIVNEPAQKETFNNQQQNSFPLVTNSYNRYIYIHGTPEEGFLGQPASHGCIRMKNTDVIERLLDENFLKLDNTKYADIA